MGAGSHHPVTLRVPPLLRQEGKGPFPPLLSKEGCREATGWFGQASIPNTLRVPTPTTHHTARTTPSAPRGRDVKNTHNLPARVPVTTRHSPLSPCGRGLG